MQPGLIRFPIQQWAYVVNDVEAACAKWTQLTGAGPFYVSLHHKGTHTYRGRVTEPDLSYAFGSVGDVHVQLIQQHCDTASVYRDLFTRGKEGFHAFALLVPDYEAERARFVAAGCPVVTEFVSAARVTRRCAGSSRRGTRSMRTGTASPILSARAERSLQ